MASLFPRWSNTVFRLVLVLILGVLVGGPLFLMAWVRAPIATGQETEVDQPVAFDHRHHVGDDGIDCRYCHYTVERSKYASIPPTQICMNCHGQVWNESPMLAAVRRSYDTGLPIHWARVYKLPDFVFFNHSVHIAKGVGCSSCHGRVDQMGRLYQVPTLQMSWCLGCHRNPAPNIRPLNEITDMTWKPNAKLGAKLVAERHINPPTYCSGCHR
jgi:hypothetical protein